MGKEYYENHHVNADFLNSVYSQETEVRYTMKIDLKSIFPFFDFSNSDAEELDELKKCVTEIAKKAVSRNIDLLPENIKFGVQFFESPKIFIKPLLGGKYYEEKTI